MVRDFIFDHMYLCTRQTDKTNHPFLSLAHLTINMSENEAHR